TPVTSASLWGHIPSFLLVPRPIRFPNPQNSGPPQKHHTLAPHPLCSRNPRCSRAITPTAPDCRSGTLSSLFSFPRTLSYPHSLLVNLSPLNVSPLGTVAIATQSRRGACKRGIFLFFGRGKPRCVQRSAEVFIAQSDRATLRRKSR